LAAPSAASGSDTQGYEPFRIEGFYGEIATDLRPLDLERAVARLVDPASGKTLHWGRNYIFSSILETASGTESVVIKQFRNQGRGARWRRRRWGSKATRSWRAAQALIAARIPTPRPLLLIESERADGPSFYVARRLHDFVEARYFFRALAKGQESEVFPEFEPERLLAEMGRTLRRLHAAGIWHRDVSVGNLLLCPGPDEASPPIVYLIDLNRVRLGARLTVSRRTRDLCRLRIFRPDQQEVFLRAYWGRDTPGFVCKSLLYRTYFRAFLFKNRAKEAVRRPFSWLGGVLLPRRHHPHIPPSPSDATKRDQTVWDELSDQPHQHAGRWQRLLVRLADGPHHSRELAAATGVLPKAWRRYKELRRELYREPIPWTGIGVAVQPGPVEPRLILAGLEKLGVRQVLLRLHLWQADQHAEELARELHARGYELAFALAQNRDLVRDMDSWRQALTETAERLRPFGRHFQIGQAINRSKWGIWNSSEYLRLAAAASEILRRDDEVRLLGPAVIDYEPHRLAGVLNVPWEGVDFDIVTSLLYVDRRGAPENRQLGFDTVDKVAQLKAIAEVSRNCGERLWITEFNWPLWEGPHSPAGRAVAVDQESQADFLVRYYLMTLGTGLVERVYWWQLVARGYGLSRLDEKGELVCHPSFRALANLNRQLEEATFMGPLQTDDSLRLYDFESTGGQRVIVGWSTNGEQSVALPGRVGRLVSRDGETLQHDASRQVRVGSSPRYFWLG
jgi:hypothetical protein